MTDTQQGQVQILGLRRPDPENQPKMQTEKFFNKGWRAPSVTELLGNFDHYIAQIPEDMRWNLYYTVSQCVEASGRQLVYQDVLPFDIDGIDKSEDVDKYIVAICKGLKVHRSQVGIVFSGNGLQVLVQTIHPITEVEQFEKLRNCYKSVCGRIAHEIFSAGLYCSEVDATVWSPARLMRLPGTVNDKTWKDLPKAEAYLINGKMEPLDFDLSKEADIPILEENEHIAPQALRKFPKPDTEAVLTECLFLQHCQENQEEISEVQWYGALSIVARLENGRALAHEMSEGHPQYCAKLTDRKIDQALKASGPRTCINIGSMWEGCLQCPHFEQVTSPIVLRGENYIKTQDTGFYNVVQTPEGEKLGKPAYEDLIAYYNKQHRYIVDAKTGSVFIWIGTHWVEQDNRAVEAFAYDNMVPKPGTNITAEFKARMELTHQVSSEWFNKSSERKMNFQNGTLNLETMSFDKHNPLDGFLSTLAYEYNQEAESPRFDLFMREITGGDDHINKMLLEFAGYSFSGMPCIYSKALLLVGDGSNGKSTFLDILQECAGEDAYSTVSLGEINNEQHRARMYGKLFNMSEEVPRKALTESSTFKRIVTGGEVSYKVVYKPTFSAKNKTKLLNACNALPSSEDNSHGLYRRMLIVPFSQLFDDDTKDIHLISKLRAERSGILNRIIEGYQRLVRQGHFTTSKTVEKAGKDYELDNDRVLRWAMDELEESPGMCTSITDLYNCYRDDCIAQGIPTMRIEEQRIVVRTLLGKFKNVIRGRSNTKDKQIASLKGLCFKGQVMQQGGF